ncbi:MAG: tRNA uridine-5-carboxymethylaminomethyl(34) synthesis enzyme MnmG [Chitinophagales bacterium]|nr:tRNA uridine-5-carboxymethylaminomethyl(34) synthesis enzyme MnmG [Chitinophagales bacterium]
MFKEYDIIVVGAGHAGCEAAAAAANIGSSVLLVTMNMQTIAQMSCNPAMGGIAKGQIVREIDALGGYSALVSDHSMIQFRMLNKSKGPAMWSPRTQNDRQLFATDWRSRLENIPNVDFWQEMVSGIVVENNQVKGVKTGMGMTIHSKAVILTSGTFLNGTIHIGEKKFGGGRAGERAATGITEQLVELGFESGRMKTGTPPRLDGRSINYEILEVQHGDEDIQGFSFLDSRKPEIQKNCWVAYTNPKVHQMLQSGFDRSPMFNGRIRGIGPRYCPSIEDKIDRFAERDRHQLFVEPEGWNTVEIYLNGFSTSLPEDVQYKALQLIPGFENAKIFRPGYAIEYDYFPPTQLSLSLETKLVQNLYFAGQINGTTGYEEAACQGLMAGINAHLQCTDKDPLILKRSEAYIGVLIDDLINKGTDEPYRMFTSRAEFRILLRQDNADQRLTPIGHKIGLASDERYEKVKNKTASISNVLNFIKNLSVDPEYINPILNKLGSAEINQKMKLKKVLSRPGVTLDLVIDNVPGVADELRKYSQEILTASEIELKYDGYIQKEKEMVDKMNRLESVILKEDLPYLEMPSLSAEAKEKLNKVRPATIGQASRISGVSPSDISVLMVYVGR